MEPKKIIVNGVEYGSLEQVPEALRHIFADQDKNGVPDILEGKIGNINWVDMFKQAASSGGQPFVTQNFVVDGKTYSNLNEVPEPKRSEIIEKMKKLDKGWEGFGAGPVGPAAARINPTVFETPMAGTSSDKVFKILIALVGALVLAVAIGLFVYFAVLPQK